MRLILKNKLFFSVAALLMVVLLTGCPYSSSVPIDEGTVKIPVELAGKWIAAEENESENPTFFVISIDDSYHATAKKNGIFDFGQFLFANHLSLNIFGCGWRNIY